jgi:putative sigma-54 modulation protein
MRRKNWILVSRNCILEDMKLILSTHNVTLTKAIEDHVIAGLKSSNILTSAIDARVTLEHDHTKRSGKAVQSCSMRLGMRGPDLFAEDSESDLYAAIDRVTKKIQQQIRTRHSKVKAHKHKVTPPS